MWDLSFKAPCSGSMESSPLDHQESPGGCICVELECSRKKVQQGTAQHRKAELSGSRRGVGWWESREEGSEKGRSRRKRERQQ